ncbi:SMI1/KNR4 family protein [Pseudoalteromonas maricaloris]|uniref:SMI1/KNR4 family protein n=1 Tax=Pseudoalteromonas maricaloris TaxID=184924 RepID=UPI00029A22D9|nr:SMI1/KNR4 family protein [Pseudoalteromonas flavipulchra]
MENWERIIKWLEKNAPSIKEAIQPPASQELIEKVQSLVGLELPDDFKRLYATSNGISPDARANLFFGMTFIPLERVCEHLEAINSRDSDFYLIHADRGIKSEYRLSTSRIPFADDFGTSLLCIDLNPDENGTLGQVVFIDYNMDTGLLLASSITELVQQFAEALEAGKYQLLEEAKTDGVEWLDPERSIDPVNWYNSPTWSYVES